MTPAHIMQSRLASLYAMGRMSPTEAWFFGLGGLPGSERDAEPKHLPLNDRALPVAAGIDSVRDGRHFRVRAGLDQGCSLRPVHDHQGQPKRLEPIGQQVRQAPCDATPEAPVRSLDLGGVAVRPADLVIEVALADAQRLTPTPQQGGEAVLIPNNDRPNRHVTPLRTDAPHSADMASFAPPVQPHSLNHGDDHD